MKKVSLLVLALSLTVVSVVSAKDSSSARTINIDPQVKITKEQNGLVNPVKNVESLNSNQINKILEEMNFTEKEIGEIPVDIKKQLVTRGGKSAELKQETQQFYRSLDGKRYEITEQNKEEIEKIKKADKEKLLGKESEISTLGMDSKTDGIFSVKGIMALYGETSSEYKYDYWTWYEWNGVPNFYLKDSIAQSWQSFAVSVSSNGAHNRQAYCTNPSEQQYPYAVKPSVTGSQASFDLYGSGCKQYGALHDDIRIPKSQKGNTGTYISSYAHPYVNSLLRAILGILSITWPDYVGDEYNLRHTFEIGK
ncbi:hypothetical protein YDYSY3_60540 [Paenibacillus chitinolyticus]|uniref:hypothetical protein n=1 Tax=Paenibacillus chitinolyticus TaxID=79263 RepID=UPI0026E4C762|nr:hypothetical protein [Paenibacillus chitinolyticus]GKS15054.1 hypothetical protein YDYSY3_60540 [Paenibacillus chitinolyticus]